MEVTATEQLPTAHGEFTVVSFKSVLDGTEHLALVMGEVRAARRCCCVRGDSVYCKPQSLNPQPTEP